MGDRDDGSYRSEWGVGAMSDMSPSFEMVGGCGVTQDIVAVKTGYGPEGAGADRQIQRFVVIETMGCDVLMGHIKGHKAKSRRTGYVGVFPSLARERVN